MKEETSADQFVAEAAAKVKKPRLKGKPTITPVTKPRLPMSTRLPEDLIDSIDEYALKTGQTRNHSIEKLLYRALKQWREKIKGKEDAND